MVVHDGPNIQVKLLELNAEPAIEMTGPRVSWILSDLFMGIEEICVQPFFRTILPRSQSEGLSEHFVKCLDVEVFPPPHV